MGLLIIALFSGTQLARAQTSTWRGNHPNNSNWGSAQNWTLQNQINNKNLSPVVNGNALIFQGSNRPNNTNDLTGWSFAGIQFFSGAGAFVLNGNAISLTGTILNNSTNLQNINLAALTFAATREINANTGDIIINSVVQGAGGLTKNGTGTLTLSDNNTYTGTTTIKAGSISLSHANALGTSGNITFSGGELQYGSAITTDLSSRIKNSASSILIDTNSNNVTFSSAVGSTNSGGLTKNGAGTLTLSNTNTYRGATTINAGTLVLNGSAANSTISIANGATLKGSGSAAGAIVSGTIGPGNSPGILTVGALSLNSGGVYTWEMADATGVAGTGWDQIATSGLLTINSTSGSPFTIAITSSGAPTNWTGNSTQAWDILTYGSQSGFDATKFTLNTSAFAGFTADGSIWAISDTGSAVRLTYTPPSTWNGGTGNWGDGFDLPLAGGNMSMLFTGAGGTVTNNIPIADLSSLAGSIIFSSTAGAYTLVANSGSAGYDTASALVHNGNIVNNSTATQTINLALTSNTTRVYEAVGNLTIGGVISGTGGLTKNGTGTLTLTGANNFSGNTTINTGTVEIGNANAAGTGRIVQTDGNSLLKIDTTGTISNDMSVYNVLASQSATLSGAITVNNATWDVDDGTTLTISGDIDGSAGVTKNGNGTLVLSGNNTYTAATTINAGTLNAASTNALGSNNTVQVNGGTLLASADDAINGMNITLNGTSTTVATLAFSGNYSGAVGNLTLSANSIIDLGAGSTRLSFHDIEMGIYFLKFHNWTGATLWDGGTGNDTDRVYIISAPGNYDVSRIQFYSGTTNDSFLGTGFDLGLTATSFDPSLSGYQIIPVPEPETWATGLLLVLGGAVWLWRKRSVFTTQSDLEGAAPSAPPVGKTSAPLGASRSVGVLRTGLEQCGPDVPHSMGRRIRA